MGLIRLLLALSVVIVHSSHRGPFGLSLVGGQAAVQAFYVISGFYMALVLCRKYPRGGAGYRTFIGARVMRLAPVYFTVLALSIVLPATGLIRHPAFDRWRHDVHGMSPGAALLYGGSQLVVLGQDAVWFTRYDPATGHAHLDPILPDGRTLVGERDVDGVAGTLPAGSPRDGMDFLFVAQAWTLAVEFTFYLIAPFVVRRVGRIGVLFLLSCGVRATLAHFGHSKTPWSYRFFPSELSIFLMGSAAYHAYAWLESARPALLRRGGLVALPALAGIILFLFQFDLPLRALIVIGATAVSLPFVFALTKRSRLDRWVGELSYPLYMSHELVRLVLAHFGGSPGAWGMIAASLVASVALLALVEQPFERVRARFVARRMSRHRRRDPVAGEMAAAVMPAAAA